MYIALVYQALLLLDGLYTFGWIRLTLDCMEWAFYYTFTGFSVYVIYHTSCAFACTYVPG